MAKPSSDITNRIDSTPPCIKQYCKPPSFKKKFDMETNVSYESPQSMVLLLLEGAIRESYSSFSNRVVKCQGSFGKDLSTWRVHRSWLLVTGTGCLSTLGDRGHWDFKGSFDVEDGQNDDEGEAKPKRPQGQRFPGATSVAILAPRQLQQNIDKDHYMSEWCGRECKWFMEEVPQPKPCSFALEDKITRKCGMSGDMRKKGFWYGFG